MQTFLPYPDYALSAQALDYRRLGKQRVECLQILKALEGGSKGWASHPATRMWRGHELALCRYAIAMCEEWRARGYNDTLLPRFQAKLDQLTALGRTDAPPPWLGYPGYHAAHRANLKRKDPTFYSAFTEDPSQPYLWWDPKAGWTALHSATTKVAA